MFPLPNTEYTDPDLDLDLKHLLWINATQSVDFRIKCPLQIQQCTPSHSQWISNVLLHLSWANRIPSDLEFTLHLISSTPTTVPLNATPNRLLMWCIFLGSPVEEEALKVQDKS